MRAMLQVFSFDLVSKLFLALATMALIRYMPASEYATYTFALALAGLILQGYVAAFNRLYVVSYDELGLPAADGGFLQLQLLGVLVLALLGLPFLRQMGASYLATAMLAAAMCLSEFVKTRFQRDEHFLNFSLIEIARSATFLALVAIIVFAAGTRIEAAYPLLAQAASMSLVFAVALRYHQPVRGAGLRRSLVLLQRLFRRQDRYLFGYFVVLAGFSQVDVFVVKWLTDDLQLASYGSAFRYYTLLALALGAVNTVLLPAVHRARHEGGLGPLLQRQQRMLLLFVPLVLAGAWAAGWAIPLIDGGRYPAAITIFRVLSLSAILSFAFSPYANLVISEGAYRFLFGLVIVVTLLATVLDSLLVPKLGAVGAAVGHLVTFGILNGACYARARRLVQGLSARIVEAQP